VVGVKRFCVSPAYAGIDRGGDSSSCEHAGFPRIRGDRPLDSEKSDQDAAFPPHTRGSTCAGGLWSETSSVSPAYAGIDPSGVHLTDELIGFPRIRGDRPARTVSGVVWPPFPPHTRGSTEAAQPSVEEP